MGAAGSPNNAKSSSIEGLNSRLCSRDSLRGRAIHRQPCSVWRVTAGILDLGGQAMRHTDLAAGYTSYFRSTERRSLIGTDPQEYFGERSSAVS